MAVFSTKEAAAILAAVACGGRGGSVSHAQLKRWANTGALVPSVRSNTGRGGARLYDFADLVVARVLGLLSDGGRIPAKRQGRVLAALSEVRGQAPGRLVLRGDLRSGDWQTAPASDDPWYSPTAVVISLGDVAEELRNACAAASRSSGRAGGGELSAAHERTEAMPSNAGNRGDGTKSPDASRETTPPGYTIAQAANITGLSRRQLEHLDQTGLVSPSLRRPGGKRRYYSFFELVELRTIARLRGDGQERISLQKVRKVVAELAKVRDRPLRAWTLFSDGGTFWLDESDESLADALDFWPVVLAVSLHGIECEVCRECDRLRLPCRAPT